MSCKCLCLQFDAHATEALNAFRRQTVRVVNQSTIHPSLGLSKVQLLLDALPFAPDEPVEARLGDARLSAVVNLIRDQWRFYRVWGHGADEVHPVTRHLIGHLGDPNGQTAVLGTTLLGMLDTMLAIQQGTGGAAGLGREIREARRVPITRTFPV